MVGRALVLISILVASGATPGGNRRTSSTCNQPWHNDLLVPVNDSRIEYIGRFDRSEPGEARFSWSGCQISFRINGTSASALISASLAGDRFGVITDGLFTRSFTATTRDHPKKRCAKKYSLVSGLSAGVHHVVLWKLSEPRAPNHKHGGWVAGVSLFQGLHLPPDTQLVPLTQPPSRHLRFIGDSDTAGFCCDFQGGSKEISDVENNYATWSAQLARMFGARYTAQAVSGIGVMDHRTGVQGSRPETLPITDYLSRANPFHQGSAWNTSAHSADAVVALIGPNDFDSENPAWPDHRDTTPFRRALHAMLAKLRGEYASAEHKPKFVLVCGGSGDGLIGGDRLVRGGGPCPATRVFVEEWNSEHPEWRAAYTTVHRGTWWFLNYGPAAREYQGCMSHYNPSGHSVLAQELQPQLASVLGWETSVPANYNWCEDHSECSSWWAVQTPQSLRHLITTSRHLAGY